MLKIVRLENISMPFKSNPEKATLRRGAILQREQSREGD